MKHLFTSLFLLMAVFGFGQLSAGDIAFIGFNQDPGPPADEDDDFTFIALADIPAGTVLYFTEQGVDVNTMSWFVNTEGHFSWTAPAGGLSCGSIVHIYESVASPNTFVATSGTTSGLLVGSGWSLSAGDQVLAYQASSAAATIATCTFISGIHMEDDLGTGLGETNGWTSLSYSGTGLSYCHLPPGLTNGVNCISLYDGGTPEWDNGKYNGTLTGLSSTLRPLINNKSNWLTDDVTAYNISPGAFSPSVTCAAPCNNPTVPTLSAPAFCAGGSSTISITGTLNDATAWNIYSGSCGGTLVGTTATSSFVVSPGSTTTYYVRGEGGCVSPGSCATVTVTVNSAPTVTPLSQTNVSCNGGANGAAAVNAATGGAGGYTYNWTPGNPTGDGTTSVTGLTAGTWTCTVTDANSCTGSANFTITQPTTLALTASSQTNIACNGGANGAAAVSAATGGAGGYTYDWTPGNPTGDGTTSVTGLTAGTWTCTVTDANSCTASVNFTLTQPTAIGLTASSQTNIACNGGSNGAAAVSAATGGAGGYTYNWTPGNPTGDGTTSVTGLTAGTWTCTVTDANSCTASVNFTLTQPTTLALAASSQTNIACNGGSNGAAAVSAATGGAGGYTYNWTPGNPTGDGTTSVTGLTAGTWTCTVTDANSCTASVNFTLTQPTAIGLTASSQTNIACNGGSNGAAAVSAATGGAGGYTYDWTPGNPTGDGTTSVTGLTAGTWTCTVTDANSCTASVNFTLTQPTAIGLTASSQTNIACNGGSNGAAAVSAATGGAGGYTYNWTPGNPVGDGTTSVTGLTAGTWTCTVTDANSCTASVNFTLTQPTTLALAASSQTNIACNGGSNGAAAVSAATGGAGGYTYNWTPGNPVGDGTTSVTGLTAGTWTCTVTDANSCTASVNFTLTQPTAIGLTASSQTNIACNGGSNGAAAVSAATGGAGGYTYNWTPGNPVGDGTTSVTGLTAGTWTCTVTDANSCTASVNFTLTQPTTLALAASSQTNIACNGGSNGAAAVSAATGGAGGYTYNWTPGNPTGDGTTSVTGLTAGTWTCTVTDANSCTASVNFTLTQPTAIGLTASSQTNIACNGGSNGAAAVSAATGGAGGYTYDWTPGNPTGDGTTSVTGLTAGTWTCTVTDANSCTASVNFTLTQPTAIGLTASSQTNIACNGGANGAAAVSAATGGAGGYTYNWTPGNPTGDGTTSVTGLTAGTWTCTVTDANSCTASVNFTLTQPTAIDLTLASSSNATCGNSDGALTVNPATGGAGGYTYDWTPGNPTGDGTTSVSGLAPGTWTCTVMDANACSVSFDFTVGNTGTPDDASFSYGASAYCVNSADPVATVTGLGGGTFSSSPAGLSINTSTGTIDVSASTPNTYTVTYTTNGTCPNSSDVSVTINALDDASFSYGAASYCVNATDPAPAITGLGGGTFSSSPAGLSINASTGAIDVSASTPNTYTVTYTTAGACPNSSNVSVTIDALDDASFSYGVASYCVNAADPTPAITGLGGGTFSSSPAGLSINVSTGAIDVSASTPNTYTVTYTTAGICPNSSNVNVTINAMDDASFSYSAATYCPNDIDPTPAITGLGGGTFSSSPAGLSINASTGAIDLSASTQNTYTVTYTTSGTCPNSSNATVTVLDNTPAVADLATLADVTDECQVTSVAAPTATDNCAGTVTGTPNVTFPITTQGTTVITWTYDDGNGNTSTQTQNVIITDMTAPVPDQASLADVTDECQVNSVAAPVATDNCAGTVTGTPNVTFPITTQGTTVITWTYDDGNGNITTQLQNVIITDAIAPVPDLATLADVTDECQVTSVVAPVATDNCAGTVTGTPDVTFPITAQGTTVITWTYDDGNGNTSTQTQNIVLTDVSAPVPDSMGLSSLAACGPITPATPTASDNCAGSVAGTPDVAFPITASTVITWTYDDGNGNVYTQTQDVTINTVDASVTQTDTSITALASGASYQWIHCETGQEIVGETGQSYTATANGSYAVIVTDNGCTDTSDCVTISVIGLDEVETTSFVVFPNPSQTGNFTIRVDGALKQVEVTDMLGRRVDVIVDLVNKTVHGETLSTGSYFVRILTEQDIHLTSTIQVQR